MKFSENDIKIHNSKDGFFVCSYMNPITKKRVRNRFIKLKDAEEHRYEVVENFKAKDLTKSSDLFVNQLIEIHLERDPESYLRERKKYFEDFCKTFGHYRIGELTKHVLHIWFKKIQKENNLGERTMNRLKCNINCLFRFLIEEEVITSNPLDSIKYSNNVAPIRKRTLLSVHEINQILEGAKAYSPGLIYPILFMLAHTGARKGEIIALKWKHVDFNNGILHFYDTKNGEDRTIKLNNILTEMLKSLPQISSWVFPYKYGQPISKSQVHRLVVEFQFHHPQVKRWRLHDLRHSFAYNFLRQGGNMYQLKTILGHKSIQMTVDLYGRLEGHDVDFESPYEIKKEIED